jgi:hypothetical protein
MKFGKSSGIQRKSIDSSINTNSRIDLYSRIATDFLKDFLIDDFFDKQKINSFEIFRYFLNLLDQDFSIEEDEHIEKI